MINCFERLAQSACDLANKYEARTTRVKEVSSMQAATSLQIEEFDSNHSDIVRYLEKNKAKKKSAQKIAREAVERTNKLYKDSFTRRGKLEKIAIERRKAEKYANAFKPCIDANSKKITRQKTSIQEQYKKTSTKREKIIQSIQQEAIERDMERHPENYNLSFRPFIEELSLIHICRCRRYAVCRSRWSPYH
eukprot:TRINITY_DN5347_c0_g1_i2.p1 TRINITY_DN5347_c0_g1~~TRINITY_DN5347_c0_g1_i2.p1  ORF type:complete len:192 (-),score=35.70 TRINITY_DN5347_c0_g1_i2:20-595(-)